MGQLRSLVTGCNRAMVTTAFQELRCLVATLSYGNSWSRMNSELPRKPTDAHDLLVTFTDASRYLHGTFTWLLAKSSMNVLAMEWAAEASMSKKMKHLPVVQISRLSKEQLWSRLLQEHSRTQLVTSYVFVNELCEIHMSKNASWEPSRSLHGPSRIATKSKISKSFTWPFTFPSRTFTDWDDLPTLENPFTLPFTDPSRTFTDCDLMTLACFGVSYGDSSYEQ